jgi:hypothetical protein
LNVGRHTSAHFATHERTTFRTSKRTEVPFRYCDPILPCSNSHHSNSRARIAFQCLDASALTPRLFSLSIPQRSSLVVTALDHLGTIPTTDVRHTSKPVPRIRLNLNLHLANLTLPREEQGVDDATALFSRRREMWSIVIGRAIWALRIG